MIAAAAAARRRRQNEVLDCFRIAGATAPERAKPVDQLGLRETREMTALMERQILRPGLRTGTWYLDEAAYAAHRDERRPVRVMAIVAVLLVLAGILLLAVVSQQL